MGAGLYATANKFVETANEQNPTHKLGQIHQDGDRVFQYVKFDNGTGNVAAAAGKLAYWKTLGTIVTSDNTDAVSSVNGGAGFFRAAITDAYHGWIEVWGSMNSASIDVAGYKGDLIVDGSTTDGTCKRLAAGQSITHKTLGILNEAGTASPIIYITIRRA